MTALVPYKVTAAKLPARVPAKVVPKTSKKLQAVVPVRQKSDNKSVQMSSPQNYKLPSMDVLETRYGKLSLNQNPIYANIAANHYILGAIFESKTAQGSGVYGSNVYNQYNDWIDFSREELALKSTFVDVQATQIETRTKLRGYTLTLNPGNTDKTAINDALALIRTYIPNFTMPTAVDDIKDEESESGRSVRRLIGLKGQALIPLNKLVNLKPRYAPKDRWSGPAYPTLTEAYRDITKPMKLPDGKDLVNFLLTVDTNSSYASNSYGKGRIDLTTDGGNKTINIHITVEAVLQWPMDFALYATSAGSPKDFYPFLFMQYIYEHKNAYIKNLGKKKNSAKAPARVNHYGHIKAMIEKEGPRRNIIVNEDGFLILGSAEANYAGQVIWISQVDKVNDYLEQMKKAYDPTEKRITLTRSEMIKNTGLFTDHNSEKFSYLNGEGNVEVLDLTGSVPLDNMTIRRDLLKKIADVKNKPFFEELDKAVMQIDAQWLAKEIAAAGADYTRYFYINNTLSAMWQRMCVGSADITWGEIGSNNLGGAFKNEAAACKIITAAAELVLANFDKVDIAYSSKIMYLRYRLMLVTKYHKELDNLNKEYKATIARNSASNVDLNNKNVKITNMPGLTYLMPHQVKANNKLSTNPSAIVIDISVGGGKCQIGSTLVPTTMGLLKLSELRDASGENTKNRGFREFDYKTQVSSFNDDDKINMTYKTKGQTIRLTTSTGDELEGLKEHKFWTLQDDGQINFSSIEDIKEGDWLPKQIGTQLFATKVPKLPHGCNQLRVNVLTPELARILGLLVTEGRIKANEVAFTNACKYTIAQYTKDWDASFNHRLNVYLRKAGDKNKVVTHTYAAYSKTIQSLFAEIGLPIAKSAKKEVPWIVRKAPENLQIQFLKAAFEGDGGIHKPDIGKNRWRVEYYSTSKQLAFQIKYMLENIGIASQMIKSKKRAHITDDQGNVTYSAYKTCYIVQLAQQHIELFANKIGFISKTKNDKLALCIEHKAGEELKGCDAEERNYNHLVHGFVNYLPVGNHLAKATTKLEEIIRPFKFMTEQGRMRVLSLSRFIHEAGGYNDIAFDNYRLTHAHTVSIWKKEAPVASRYTVDRFLKVIEGASSDIKKALFANTEFSAAYNAIVLASKYVWSKVVSKLNTGKIKAVYDLSVPGSNAYVANGYMSHNTGLLLANLANMLAEGKVTKAMILCPNKLQRSWVTEINKFSQGELNPFPISREINRRLNAMLNPKRSALNPELDNRVLKALMDKAPINTVFIVGLSFLSRGSSVQKILYGNKVIDRYKMSEFFKDYGFDWIGIDESQKVKNLNSSQTEAASVLITSAKYKRLASGTIVNNTPTDLVGQTSILNPAIFGKTQEFREAYNSDPNVASSGLRPGAAIAMAQAMIPYTARFTAKKRDWAFALPKLETKFHTVNLDPVQKTYYDAQLQNALDYIMSDPKILKLLSDPDPEKAASVEKFLTVHFQKVEQFLCAPDSVPLFTGQSGIKPEDLVSPKIKAIDEILTEHFDTINDGFKVIIFSFRKVTPEHIFKHLDKRWQKMAKVYTTKTGMKPLFEFMKNPKVKIIIANEGSIKEGQNMQMASRMIRTETQWAPGDQEQAIGRFYRPSDQYNRKTIYLDYVLTNHTIEVAKFGRLISKAIDKMRYDESDNPQFMSVPYGSRKIPMDDQLSSLPLIKMSLDTIQHYSSVESIKDYISNYSLVENWEEEQFDTLRAKKLGVTKIADSQRQTIPGSKNLHQMNAWIPRIEGVDPINGDILQPVSVIESKLTSEAEAARDAARDTDDDDDDQEMLVEVNPVKINQIVDTEFGPGYVKKIMKNDLMVLVPGIVIPVKVPKSTTYVYVDEAAEAEAKLRLKRAGKKGLPRLPGVAVDYSEDKGKGQLALPAPDKTAQPVTKPTPAKQAQDAVRDPKIKTKPDAVYETTPDGDKVNVSPDGGVEFMVDIINGSIVFMAYEEDTDADELMTNGFKLLPQYAIATVIKPEGIGAFFKAVEAKGLRVTQPVKDNFAQYAKLLKEKRLGTLSKEYYKESVHFLNVKFNDLPDENQIRFYPLVTYSHELEKYRLHIVVSLKQQPKARKLLVNKTLLPTNLVTKFTIDGPFVARVLKDKAHALSLLSQVHKKMKVIDYDDTVARIKKLKSK